MRDFYFFTSKPLRSSDCYENLKNAIKYVEGTGDPDEKNILINAKLRSFLWFYNERLNEYLFCTDEEFEILKKQIPIQDPYINHFETHRSIDAKRVVEVLMELYPELYIEIDDEIEWSGTAQEYLDTEFDY